MADSRGFVLPDFDGIVPDVLSKFMYKWSSYIRMSMYSWRQAKITVNSGAKMIDKCQSSHALLGVSWVEEVTPWVKSRQNWCTYCPRICPGIHIPEGNDKYKKSLSCWRPCSWAVRYKNSVDKDVCDFNLNFTTMRCPGSGCSKANRPFHG